MFDKSKLLHNKVLKCWNLPEFCRKPSESKNDLTNGNLELKKLYYSKTLNKEYIGRIYQMPS